MKKVNLEEIISQEFGTRTIEVLSSAFRRDGDPRTLLERWKEVMKEVAKQTLELAAENAEITTEMCMGHVMDRYIDRESILNTINQIE